MPNYFNSFPQQTMFQPQYQQQNSNGVILVSVQGEAGARSYPVAAGNTVFLIDFDAQKFWLKSTDINGIPQSLRSYKFSEDVKETPTQNNTTNFISRNEFEEWKKNIDEQFKKTLNNLELLVSKGVNSDESNVANITQPSNVPTVPTTI